MVRKACARILVGVVSVRTRKTESGPNGSSADLKDQGAAMYRNCLAYCLFPLIDSEIEYRRYGDELGFALCHKQQW